MAQVDDIANLIWIDGSLYKIKTDVVPTDGSDALITSGDLYTYLSDLIPLKGYAVADSIIFPGQTGQSTPNHADSLSLVTPYAVYNFVLEFLKYKNILDSNGNKV